MTVKETMGRLDGFKIRNAQGEVVGEIATDITTASNAIFLCTNNDNMNGMTCEDKRGYRFSFVIYVHVGRDISCVIRDVCRRRMGVNINWLPIDEGTTLYDLIEA